MQAPFTTTETRFLASGLLGSALLAGLGAGFWLSPWSPVALDRPARLAAAGQPADAVQAYTALARGRGPESTRQTALWRAAALTSVELADDAGAQVLYDEYLTRWPTGSRAADAHERLAVLYEQVFDQPTQAGAHWVAAAQLAPDRSEAGRWLLQAGRAQAAGGDITTGELTLRRATEHPQQAAAAWIALGRIELADDPARAYEDFDHAEDAATSPAEVRLARLGRVTSLERLERRESALAEVDEAIADGDADAALVRRQQRLRGGG